MERTRSTAMWALLFLTLTIIVCARCEEEGNSTSSLVQHNVTSYASSGELPQGRSQDEERNNKTNNDVVVNDKGKGRGIGGGGGSGVGQGGGGGWGWGWGGGGGGGGWWGWGCGKPQGSHSYGTGGGRRQAHKKGEYKIGEFAQCMGRSGRCGGMRLDCPLHCGGPCFYDCTRMCKAHCRR